MIRSRPDARVLPALTRAVIANALIVAVIGWAWALWSFNGDFYYRSVQEDEYLEWASFWAFLTAAAAYLIGAVRPSFHLRADWFLIGLSAFCCFVAMEEISWGQRVFGYRPPEYFLEFNFQQELNVHNIVDTRLRKLAFLLVTLGYGVILPLFIRIPGLGRLLQRMGIVAPPMALIPAFAATASVQLAYPVKFTGEWVELMLGLGFLFAAMTRTATANPHPGQMPTCTRMAIAWTMVIAAGFASAAATHRQRDSSPNNVLAAQTELRALRHDFRRGSMRGNCGTHKRLYTFAMRYDQFELLDGEFASLTAQGLPEQRAAFLLDPWNSAYWLRDNCAQGNRERMTYLYSFGPNRRRESTQWEIGGDDVAIFIRGEPATQ